jgi:hypothetical protein
MRKRVNHGTPAMQCALSTASYEGQSSREEEGDVSSIHYFLQKCNIYQMSKKLSSPVHDFCDRRFRL